VPHFESPTPPIHCFGFLKDGMGIGKIGGEISVQGGLIALHGQQTLAVSGVDGLHKGGVRVQGIGCTHPILHGQQGQQRFGDRNLVGFLIHLDLE
jgi:hypothetical protein